MVWASGATSESAAHLGAVTTGAAAVIALLVGILTVVQRSRADRRSEWWRRTQWAIDQTNSHSAQTREVGLMVLLQLLESKLATSDERRLLRDVGLNLIRRAQGDTP